MVWGISYSMHMTSGLTTSCMASSPITSWQIDGETMETLRDFIFLGPQITRWWLQPWNWKTLAPWKKNWQTCTEHWVLSHVQLLGPRGLQNSRLFHLWDFPDKNTGVGFHFLLHDKSRQHIKKQRCYFADKGPSSQSYGFSSSHVWMWELDYKESWAPKNWCFWTVVLEKTRPSNLPLEKPVRKSGSNS